MIRLSAKEARQYGLHMRGATPRKRSKGKVSHGSETALVRACIRLLQLKGHMAWRNNTTGVWDAAKGIYHTFSGLKGVSDILGVLIGGQILAVECKVGKNRLSREQQYFLDSVNEKGGFAVCVRSLEELEKALEPQ